MSGGTWNGEAVISQRKRSSNVNAERVEVTLPARITDKLVCTSFGRFDRITGADRRRHELRAWGRGEQLVRYRFNNGEWINATDVE